MRILLLAEQAATGTAPIQGFAAHDPAKERHRASRARKTGARPSPPLRLGMMEPRIIPNGMIAREAEWLPNGGFESVK